MTVINHLKDAETEALFLEVAFGWHVIAGDLGKSIVTGSDPNHVVKIQQFIGEGFGLGWDDPYAVWFRGVERPAAKYKWYPGIQSPGNGDATQGIDSVFDKDTPHSNTAWIRVECPNGSEVGIPDIDTKENPPTGLRGIYRCQKGDIYDENGDVDTADVLLTNPADIIIFGCLEIMRYSADRIDFVSLDTLRDICNASYTPDYTTLDQGVGLLGKYYEGTAFNTLKRTRIDPYVEFITSAGAPEVGLSVDSFSVRWEGFVEADYTETYTFKCTHSDGAKVWVNGTLLIDEWATTGTHTGTIALTADTKYTIKVEWYDATGDAEISLKWSSASIVEELIPQEKLYPLGISYDRFQAHPAFIQPTNFDDFLRQVLFSCNGTYQDADGKLSFYCIDELVSTFAFDETNYVKDTFTSKPRYTQQQLLSIPNRYTAAGRDIESQYMETFLPEIFIDVTEWRALAGRTIEETIAVGNTFRHQAQRNLEHYVKLRTAPIVFEFEGEPQTYPVLPGDLVTVSNAERGYVNQEALVIEATDLSVDADIDKRRFVLYLWE